MDSNENIKDAQNVQASQWPAAQPSFQKPLFALGKRDVIFAICAVIVCVFGSVFGVFGGFALGYALAASLAMVLFFSYFGGKLRPFSAICGLLAFSISAVFVCTTNGSVRFFGVVVGLLLALTCYDGLLRGRVKGNRETLGVFYTAAATIDNIEISVKSVFSGGSGNKKLIGKTLIGLLCAVPVLIIVVPLLISSDDAFRGMTEELFRDTPATLFKSALGVAFSVFLVTYGFSQKTGRISKLKEAKDGILESVYIISFLSAIAVCYLLYLFSQLAYFFSAFQGFLPDGEITYAQYARKGFFEMCTIAVINLVLVTLALVLAKKKNGRVCGAIKGLATFIAVFTLIIIATAISKMVLYIDAYGMTVLRVTTSAFMVFLTVVFISIILRIYSTKINVVKVSLVAAGCVVLVLGTVNVNALCARYNYESYLKTREGIDLKAMYELGDEGIPYIVELAAGEYENVTQVAKEYLAKAYLRDYYDDLRDCEKITPEDLKKNEKDKDFERYSIPKAKAYDSLYNYLQEHPQFGSDCKNYYK